MRFTPSGAAVANFTVASTPRTFNRTTNEWDDGETLWMRCSAWRDMAENVAESLAKGTRVVVTGRMKSRQYEKDGQTRTSIEMDVDEIGPSLRYATARVNKTDRSSGGQQGGGFGQPAQQAEFGGQVAAGQQAQQTAQQPAPWGGQQAQQQPAWGQPQPQQQGWGQPPAQPPQGAPQQALQQQQQAAQQGQQPQQQDQWATQPANDQPPY